VNKWVCIASQDMKSKILLFYCECFMQRSNENNDWNKGAWIILWWSGGVGEELGNWTSGGLSMSGDCSVLFIQKENTGFLYYWDYVFGTGSDKVSIVFFCACFLRKMLNLRSFTAWLFSFNLFITERKNSYFYRTGYICYPYF